MKIHVLTISYNGLDKLKKLKTGLFNNLNILCDQENIDAQWYIKDNGSKDGTINEIENWMLDGFYIESWGVSHNRDNFSQGVNSLFKTTNSKDNDLILLLNNDIEFADDKSLLNMYNLLTPDVGIVGARLLYNNTNKLQHAGVIFSDRYGKMPYHFRPNEVSDVNDEKNRYFQAVTAACCLMRASDFKAVGGMNENYFWAFEDIDLCLKIGQTKKIAYCGQTNIFHEESATLKKNPVNKMFLQHNVKLFKDTWLGKYEIDHEKYLKDPLYNLIK